MSDLKVEGRLHKIFATQEVSASFKKREFVVETEEQYPQMVKFELTQNKCDDISAYKEGEKIVVNFNVRGREWNNPKTNEMNYFVTLQAWRLEKSNGGGNTNSGGNTTTTKSGSDFPKAEPQDGMSDDLPF